MRNNSTYRQILYSSSIIGGANGLNYLVSLVRVKTLAVLLGPAGIGLMSLYTSIIGLVGTVSGFGMTSSGIREIAQAFTQQDQASIEKNLSILRRACWITGLLGWCLAAVLAIPLSGWVAGASGHAVAIAILGMTLLFDTISSGQKALLQGMRRIGDLARINVVAMLLNTCIAVGLFAWLRQQGIIPVLLITAAVSLGVTWWFSRHIVFKPVCLSRTDMLSGMRHLAGLGCAFMWSGLLAAGLDMITRSLVVRTSGIEAAGLYQAAWALSGIFANFILTAMGTDFYPRLTGVIYDHDNATLTVNQQTEIGILLALPGLLFTLSFAPWLMKIFYSKQFLVSSELLPWFVLGIWGRVVSWPLGYIILAKKASRSYVATETIFGALQLGLLMWTIPHFGLIGVAYSFAITYFLHVIAMLFVANLMIGFHWSAEVKKLLLIVTALLLTCFITRLAMLGWQRDIVGGILAVAGMVISLRGLAFRLGSDHRLIKLIHKVPGGKWIIQRLWAPRHTS